MGLGALLCPATGLFFPGLARSAGARPAPGRSVGRLRALPGDTSCAARGARPRTGGGSAHVRRVAAALLESPTRLALAAWGRGQALPTPALARGLSLLHYGLVFVFVLPWS